MPSLLDIRRRVRAVKSTQQITKAMKMVAASRLRRAGERVPHARPVAVEKLGGLPRRATRGDPAPHPLLDERRAPRAGGKSLLFVITADRGLCGSFNTNAIKAASTFIVEDPAREVALGLVGRRGRDYFARRGFEVRYEQVNLFAGLQFAHAKSIADAAIEAFTTGQVDSVYLVYNEFRSVISQRIVVERLLPIPRLEEASTRPPTGVHLAGGAETAGAPPIDYLYEPTPDELFNTLIPRHVAIPVWRAVAAADAGLFSFAEDPRGRGA